MASVVGRPTSSSARRRLAHRVLKATYVLLGVTAVMLLLALALGPLADESARWWWTARVLLGAGVAMCGFAVVEHSSWLKGAENELATAGALSELPDEFAVFHDVRMPSEGGRHSLRSIDDVVIGPTGVFLIATKSSSRSRVAPSLEDAEAQRNVREAQRNAVAFRSALNVWSGGHLEEGLVVPIVVYAQRDAFVERLREGPVRVVPLRWLVSEIGTRPAGHLDAKQVYRLAKALFDQIPLEDRIDHATAIARIGDFATAEARTRDTTDAPDSAEIDSCSEPKAFTALRRYSAGASRASLFEAPGLRSVGLGGCPRCGADLVPRVARAGLHAGRPFLGCSNYGATGCTYTRGPG